MPLVECSECGKSVSDKAALCPGCGCPIEFSKPENRQMEPPQQIDCSNYTKEQLWQKASDIQCKGKKADLPAAIQIYKYIIANYSESDEAAHARNQLYIIKTTEYNSAKVKPIQTIQPTTGQQNPSPSPSQSQTITSITDTDNVDGAKFDNFSKFLAAFACFIVLAMCISMYKLSSGS